MILCDSISWFQYLEMSSSEQFVLKWSGYRANISDSFKQFQSNNNFCDVTLVCEDDKQLQAHKVVLSACSPFFLNILQKNPHPHPLLFLKGIRSEQLTPVIDFLYEGEVSVLHEEIVDFLATAKELQIQGLSESHSDTKVEIEEDLENGDQVEKKIKAEDTEDEIDDIITCDEELSKPDLKPPLVNFKDHETKETFIKVDNLWICKVCQKTSKLKGDIKRHSEVHVEGVSHPCESCGKSYRSGHSLAVHKSANHKQPFKKINI